MTIPTELAKCPDCGVTVNSRAAIRCPTCHATAVIKIHANENLPVGGTSSPLEYELRPIHAGNRSLKNQERDSIQTRHGMYVEDENPSLENGIRILEEMD